MGLPSWAASPCLALPSPISRSTFCRLFSQPLFFFVAQDSALPSSYLVCAYINPTDPDPKPPTNPRNAARQTAYQAANEWIDTSFVFDLIQYNIHPLARLDNWLTSIGLFSTSNTATHTYGSTTVLIPWSRRPWKDGRVTAEALPNEFLGGEGCCGLVAPFLSPTLAFLSYASWMPEAHFRPELTRDRRRRRMKRRMDTVLNVKSAPFPPPPPSFLPPFS
ncbi:hypothetical protein L249_1582 [Ophiocordyceps polyrhachis-furcata BCC 54312]|uniref:Uncharacterized protein n=1 Tax=Ophiocordyceps polyrhachis-furcata BCC 54312 TaxID=1330021 RepID=A0A367L3X9_9HYPO|nr:hypothetical protein L249_1582 [Ophiocordyceps polyrhachis-furcata BCC 54312]